jgi:hypothetical protein
VEQVERQDIQALKERARVMLQGDARLMQLHGGECALLVPSGFHFFMVCVMLYQSTL